MIPESILRTFLILLLAAMEAGAQRTEPKEVSAARICAEGYRLYEQKHYVALTVFSDSKIPVRSLASASA
jgi:hypothetical protein